MSSITFLGTGGGRYVILSQRRYSGGLWLNFGPQIILDPGPGALIRALQFEKDPSKLDALLISHRHLDHYNDAEILVEAMTNGLKRRKGLLVTVPSVLEYISEYHRRGIDILTVDAFDKFKVKELEIQALPTKEHADGVGFKFFTPEGAVIYSSDTGFSENLAEKYKGARLLILNVIFPSGKPIKPHLNTDTATEIVKISKPKLCVITHFGMSMLNANPEKQALRIEEKTGVKTIAATDGQTIDLKHLKEEQTVLNGF